jgi:LCP family protein required for cell wall assembly
MNRIKDSFSKIKLPNFRGRLKGLGRTPLILAVVTIALMVVAFIGARSILRCWTMTKLPGITTAGCGAGSSGGLQDPTISVNEEGTPVSLPPTPVAVPEMQLPAWDGASRVNILFIGLDYRDYIANEGPPRSDSMILFTIDPVTKTAGMLSIPRDLWVNIPSIGYSRINTAYASGEGNKLPGGGPGLAMKTVEQFIGVPIQYFGQIDFHAFEEAIDKMGGLYICIPEKIRIDPIGNKKPENLRPGCQTLWGYQVLAFARNRHTQNGDVDRANRQQLVIMALRDQIFSPANFPTMVAKAPQVYAEASAGLRTNLTFEDLMKLGVLMQQIPPDKIKRGVIDYTMGVLDNVTLGGQNASILKPIPDKIRVLRDEIFSEGGAVSPMASGDPVVLMQQDAARVKILNGSIQPDLAQRTGNYLLTQGMQVTEVGTAQNGYQNTVIVIYGPKLYTLKYLASTFGITSSAQIIFSQEPATTADIEVRLGNDWVSRLPAGY